MRASGILLPVSSLPSPYGIGTLGRAAYEWVDFLADCGQTYWQVLPVGPTSFGDSPYQSFSSFAGNPYLIDLDFLMIDGFLTPEELPEDDFPICTIDYAKIYHERYPVLRKAAARLSVQNPDFQAFCREQADWLEDYAAFMVLKEQHNMASFQTWEDDLRMYKKDAVQHALQGQDAKKHVWRALAYFFSFQWENLKRYANERGVRIFGDLPIYVSPDSADLWANSELFQLDDTCRMSAVAGCPPDAFSSTGQLWGNPLYDWQAHKNTNYQWWINRLRHAGAWYDVVRIDHFRGFTGYYAIPADHDTALDGEWKQGPGMDFMEAVRKTLPELFLIAEDLGYLTPDVKQLLKDSGLPGMKVLQFAFDDSRNSDYLPHNLTRNSVVYTGTHDNPTTEGWVQAGNPFEVQYASDYFNIEKTHLTDAMIRAAFASVCETAIIPMQDWLGLGQTARMNLPSTIGGNWAWRLQKKQMESCQQKIRDYTILYSR